MTNRTRAMAECLMLYIEKTFLQVPVERQPTSVELEDALMITANALAVWEPGQTPQDAITETCDEGAMDPTPEDKEEIATIIKDNHWF